MVFKRGIAGVAAAAALALVAPVPAGALEITSLASLGDAADAVRVADFDGDGRDDFAMAADCEVVVLLRRSFTTNGMPPALNRLDGFADPCGASRGLLALGDVTGDGAVDIINGAVDRPGVKLHASRGDGTFTAPASSPTVGAPQELVTGDLNGDGRADLIVRRKTAIDVALAAPGGFLPPTSYGTFDESFSLAVGRTDAGPTLDVVVGATVGGRYKLVRFNGNGDGTLAAGELTETLVAGAGLLAAPLRGGLGRDDLVSVGGGIQTMHTGADGAFTSGRARIDQSWDSVTAADFDGDGDLDVAAVGHRDHAAIVVHFNDGTGLFTTQRRVENPLMAPLTSVQATDFDSDGHKDVVAMAKGTLFVLRSWPEVSVAHAVDAFDTVPVGAQSGARTATFRNTGIRPVALGQATVTERRGRAVFSITSDGCSGPHARGRRDLLGHARLPADRRRPVRGVHQRRRTVRWRDHGLRRHRRRRTGRGPHRQDRTHGHAQDRQADAQDRPEPRPEGHHQVQRDVHGQGLAAPEGQAGREGHGHGRQDAHAQALEGRQADAQAGQEREAHAAPDRDRRGRQRPHDDEDDHRPALSMG